MGYSKYTFQKVKKKFGLKATKKPLFEDFQPIPISDWLKRTLSISTRLTLNSEKSRSEGIIAPFLFELADRNQDKITLFSGENLDVDAALDLNGEIDFIINHVPDSALLDAPIFCIIEAKQHIIENSLGQCIAQLIAAQRYNQKEEQPLSIVYGCVTNGETWQFLLLTNQNIYIDQNRYYLERPDKILGILQHIVDKIKVK